MCQHNSPSRSCATKLYKNPEHTPSVPPAFQPPSAPSHSHPPCSPPVLPSKSQSSSHPGPISAHLRPICLPQQPLCIRPWPCAGLCAAVRLIVILASAVCSLFAPSISFSPTDIMIVLCPHSQSAIRACPVAYSIVIVEPRNTVFRRSGLALSPLRATCAAVPSRTISLQMLATQNLPHHGGQRAGTLLSSYLSHLANRHSAPGNVTPTLEHTRRAFGSHSVVRTIASHPPGEELAADREWRHCRPTRTLASFFSGEYAGRQPCLGTWAALDRES